jgi:hypothetical protein
MAEKNIAALLDKAAYTVQVRYQHSDSEHLYTYICNLPELTTGDFVVVPTTVKESAYKPEKTFLPQEEFVTAQLAKDARRILKGQRLSIACVVAIDEHVDIQPDDVTEYKWVVSKVDLAVYDALLARNKQIIDAVQTAYQRNIRKSFADRILGELPETDKTKLLKLLNK